MPLDATSLDRIEKSLLYCRWDKRDHDSSQTSPSIAISRLVVQGNYADAFKHPSAKNLVKSTNHPLCKPNGTTSTPHFSIADQLCPSTAGPEDELLSLAVGVACLHAFVQVNWTGPDLDFTPNAFLAGDDQAYTEDELNLQAISELSFGGEPAYHLSKSAAFLRIAQVLFEQPFQHVTTVAWWRLRASSIHQHLLDEPVAFPTALLPDIDNLIARLQDERDLAGRLILERGLAHHLVGSDKVAGEDFVRAAHATGLQFELSGAMGRRTKFQQTDISQLVLLAESRKRESDGKASGEHEKVPPEADSTGESTKRDMPETLLLNDDTLLEHTHFTSSSAGTSDLSHIDPQSQPALDPLDQCIILSLCLNVKNTSPLHGLTSEQMSAYVSRVISHPRNWSVHTMALLLRSRLESTRTRTVERATLQLQALIDQMPTSDSSLSERLLYFHSIPLPSKWEMERELAIRFLSLGVVRSALDIFERLEMWEESVQCWQSMEKPEKGIAIVRDLLEGRKEEAETVVLRGKSLLDRQRPKLDRAREAKLWCLLGDLEKASALEHYERAWQVSQETSARAARSLGGYHFAKGDFSAAIPYLRRGTTINPLYSRTWFVLGCAYIRTEDWQDAKECFSRCVSIDDEDAESWSNLASMYLRMGEAGEAIHLEHVELPSQSQKLSEEVADGSGSIPFSNKFLAFRALKQGIKYSYENWRMWSNYMIVAVDVGELSEACRAQARVVELRSEKVGDACVDNAVLERLVNAVTRAPSKEVDAVEDGDVRAAVHNPNEGHGLKRRVEELFTRTILPRISGSPQIFRAWARLLVWESKWGEALDAHMNAYRVAVVNDAKVETDLTRWREAVGEVQEIVEVMRNLGPRAAHEGKGGMKNWKFQARSVVRTFMGRTKAAFADEAEWERLTDLLEDLRKED